MRKYVRAHERERAVPQLTLKLPPKVYDAVMESARICDVSPLDVLGQTKRADATRARHHAMRRLRREGYSFGKIRRWSGRHHSSVMYALKAKGV